MNATVIMKFSVLKILFHCYSFSCLSQAIFEALDFRGLSQWLHAKVIRHAAGFTH